MNDEYPGAGLHKRASWLRPGIVAAVVIATVVVAVGLIRPAPENTGPVAVGERAPVFELEYLDEPGTLTTADLQGRAVLLNFWASWCAPCRREMPLLEDLWQEYGGRGLVIVGVDVRDAPAAAREFAEEVGVTYPLVVDPDVVLAGALGIDPLPQTFMLDPGGRFLPVGPGGGVSYLGELEEDAIRERIEEALAQ